MIAHSKATGLPNFAAGRFERRGMRQMTMMIKMMMVMMYMYIVILEYAA